MAGPLRILIVDDSPEDRELYRRMLAQDPGQEYEFLEAELGEDGLELARRERPDCLLLDYRLPDVDGLEFLDRLLRDGPVPVIILTGQGSEAVAVQAMKSGAQDYLLKGAISRQELPRAVHNAIEKVALRRKVEERTAELARANDALQKMYGEQEELVRQRTAELSRAMVREQEARTGRRFAFTHGARERSAQLAPQQPEQRVHVVRMPEHAVTARLVAARG